MWEDVWLPGCGKLSEVVQQHRSLVEANRRVCDLALREGGWNMDLLSELVPAGVRDKIVDMIPPSPDKGADRVAWRCTGDGLFSNASAYASLLEPSLMVKDSIYNGVWKWKGPERFRTHLWKMTQSALVTNVWRKRRGLVESDICPVCGREEESLSHVFRECERVQMMWRLVARGRLTQDFYVEDFQEWLRRNLVRPKVRGDDQWSLTFGVAVQTIWRARNDKVFRNILESGIQMGYKVRAQVDAIVESLKAHDSWQPKKSKTVEGRVIKWSPPGEGWLKLNCDGAVVDFGARAACGGVFRGSGGEFVLGFAKGVEAASITEAELQAILVGLRLSIQKRFDKVCVETDSMTACKLINSRCSPLHPCYNLVEDIRSSLAHMGIGAVTHVLRESNQVADGFAKFGLSLQSSCQLFEVLPNFVSIAFKADVTGTMFPCGF